MTKTQNITKKMNQDFSLTVCLLQKEKKNLIKEFLLTVKIEREINVLLGF